MAVYRSIVRRGLAAASSRAIFFPSLAALGLVLLQVGAAVNVWTSRERGQFNFSPSSSLAISEFLRMLVATLLFKREVCKRAASAGCFPMNSVSDELDLDIEDGRPSSEYNANNCLRCAQAGSVKALWCHIWRDKDIRFGFMRIALLQMLSNNLLFINYLATDPGTVYLTKSGIAVAAALFTTPAPGLKSQKTRWMAFLIQTSGLVLSQFHPQQHSRASTHQLYLNSCLVGQAIFSALSEIYNDKLLKCTDVGANGASIVLGVFGAILNLFAHTLVRQYSAYKPTFFDRYNIKGLSVVLMTTFMALISTVTPKAVDARTRWLTNGLTTVALLFLSTYFFSLNHGSFLIPGTALIFIATLVYMQFTPSEYGGALSSMHERTPAISPPSAIKKSRFCLLIMASFIGAGIVPFVTVIQLPHTPEYSLVMRDDIDGRCLTPPADIISPFTDNQEPYKIKTGPGNLSASPFSNTIAMIRWNTKRTERVPLLLKYKPFFHTVHISMPEMMDDKPKDYHNLTHSQYAYHETIYIQVAKTMKLILDEQPEIEGLMYFHFDSWIDLMAWVDENRQSIWYPTSHNTRQFEGDGPRYMCMTDWQKFPQWWGWYHKWNEKAVTVNREITRMNRGYRVDEDEFCVGWSDIFYIPRRFFADFIFLSYVYGCADLFHEVAIPTMLNIIDRSRRSEAAKFQSVIDRIGDCWGGCCDDSATAHDVKWTRCGHRLSYLNQELVDAHYSRLDEQTAWLAQAERQ
ncbi:hypothetical protein CTA2_4249 [Colletotrichum tanaceti]|uniref:UDP-galactose transporter n=1 Tax=Colletotrichum tanaceti TaxID=1306861 RepID=A0A4U6X4T8_9PEZI|nr:hypothetical protein CTA2_4249 [Colletotrichum tanaceti]TKW50408.1 hypothetical protein CTA1_7188 [Colletotrichum tanaceti]